VVQEAGHPAELVLGRDEPFEAAIEPGAVGGPDGEGVGVVGVVGVLDQGVGDLLAPGADLVLVDVGLIRIRTSSQ